MAPTPAPVPAAEAEAGAVAAAVPEDRGRTRRDPAPVAMTFPDEEIACFPRVPCRFEAEDGRERTAPATRPAGT
ncbi:hypothetical protein GCM10022252_59020 [Streptosporangium oxazolinicum]|uniref:Uncharacterized protein n=1 Tax=Streptosporangium oxazolinicum TaxID=909287 RepID=A0ABP8BB87_9ACTN